MLTLITALATSHSQNLLRHKWRRQGRPRRLEWHKAQRHHPGGRSRAGTVIGLDERRWLRVRRNERQPLLSLDGSDLSRSVAGVKSGRKPGSAATRNPQSG